jgi:hypothetical protein
MKSDASMNQTRDRRISWAHPPGWLAAGLFLLAGTARAGDPAYGDPDRLPPPPANAIGYPSRDPDLDVRPGFVNPPAGYGEIAFYWWLGDPLTKERLTWQLDQLAGIGIFGLQINYAHSDSGGQKWGLTYASDPPLFSEEWWKLVQWFAGEAKKRGMAISLSDYTLGVVGQGYWMDEILKEHPDLHGSVIESSTRNVQAETELVWEVPDGNVALMAYRLEGANVIPGSGLDLRPQLQERRLRWPAPAGTWRVVEVHTRVIASSVNPLDPRLGPEVIRRFFQPFEAHLPGEAGRALNGFFSDELNFGIRGNLWHRRFAAEFQKRKGYDVLPELPALFLDIGPRTPKVRLDYHDVMVALEEEAYFRPLFDWHYQRGMLYGGDHGGRGRDVTEFGDYFRTQRWMLGPGNDQPRLGHDIIKTKVQSSISHLYQRPRTWLEGYYSSGWGTTPDQLTLASIENYIMGSNLQVLHGLYYSTHGGYWEWAPPCNHFRMPYWAHMDVWMTWSRRLCYLLSQGVHRCDVAVMYPATPSMAGMDGQRATETAFDLAKKLFNDGIDFDFMDDDSLARAAVQDGELRVSGEIYRVLVLPAMKAVTFSTLQKAAAFKRAGGTVIAAGAVPLASDRLGRNDPELEALVKEIFPSVPPTTQEAVAAIEALPRDYSGPGRVLHRKIGPRDVYVVCGAPKDSRAAFRATGTVELWDPWTGSTRPLPVLSQASGATTLALPLTQTEAQLIVFNPGIPEFSTPAPVPVTRMKIEGDWEFELKPTLDNRWGDFRWPPTPTLIGAEARQLRYAAEAAPLPGWQNPDFDDSNWPKVTSSFGPRFWKLGPLPETAGVAALEIKLASLKQVDPAVPVEVDGKHYSWQPYAFSWRWGIEGDAGHQGYHGLKEEVSDAFLALGNLKFSATSSTYQPEAAGTRYYLWTSVVSEQDQPARILAGGNEPSVIWLNGERLAPATARVGVKRGPNPALLHYDQPGRGYVVFDAGNVALPEIPAATTLTTFRDRPLAMTWFGKAGILNFDTHPQAAQPAGWFRFLSPPGLRAMAVASHYKPQVWIEGQEEPAVVAAGDGRWRVSFAHPAIKPAKIALRIDQERGDYGGATLPEPIQLECAPGLIPPGDWSRIDGLASYSGGAWYRKTVTLAAEQTSGTVTLDLGNVAASAEVHVNGQLAGIRVASPWIFDITRLVKAGDNRIAVLVYNTLANHYSTIPTRYRGSPVSGLLGPVTITRAGSIAVETGR